VQSFCRERLARFKVPRYIRVVDAFPLTASGKIQKFRLREQHATQAAGGSLNITVSKSPSGA
jgi:fatty-acyl-CoA synthase